MAVQLDIFKSKRQRGTKPPLALERATHIAIADLLRKCAKPGWWCSHIAHGEKRSEATGELLRRMGLRPGVSDWMLIHQSGFYFLELKRPPNKPNAAQREFGAAVAAAGGEFAVAYSYHEAEQILKTWGVLRLAI